MAKDLFTKDEKIMYYSDFESKYIKCIITDITHCPHYDNYGNGWKFSYNIYTYTLKPENGKSFETVESGRFRKMIDE